MKIYVVSSVGKGSTLLSAFDNALKNAGVYNYNLITLSSVIPIGSKVVKTIKFKTPQEEYGYRLYVVKAEMRGSEAGKFLASGIGWYQQDDGRGVFVEHELKGDTKLAVKDEINSKINRSLSDLCKFRGIKFQEKKVRSSLSIVQVTNAPTCALSLAVYKSEVW